MLENIGIGLVEEDKCKWWLTSTILFYHYRDIVAENGSLICTLEDHIYDTEFDQHLELELGAAISRRNNLRYGYDNTGHGDSD